MRKGDRSRWVKKVRTVNEAPHLSDHKPKLMECWFRETKKGNYKKREEGIEWNALREPKTKSLFLKEMDK